MTREQSIQLGNWLKEQRAERDITVAALAKYVNLSRETIRKWEESGIPYNYIRHGLRYFFDGWEKNGRTPCTCRIHFPPSITASSSVDISSLPNVV